MPKFVKELKKAAEEPQLRAPEHFKRMEALRAQPPDCSLTSTPMRLVRIESERDADKELRVYVWNNVTVAYLIKHNSDGLDVILAEISFGHGDMESRKKAMQWFRSKVPELLHKIEQRI